MKTSLILGIVLLFVFSAYGNEGTVETSPPLEEFDTTSFDPVEAAQGQEEEAVGFEEEEAYLETASEDAEAQVQGGALSLGAEPQGDALAVYTNKLTYFGYQEADEEMYDEIYNNYSLSYPGKRRDWQ